MILDENSDRNSNLTDRKKKIICFFGLILAWKWKPNGIQSLTSQNIFRLIAVVVRFFESDCLKTWFAQNVKIRLFKSPYIPLLVLKLPNFMFNRYDNLTVLTALTVLTVLTVQQFHTLTVYYLPALGILPVEIEPVKVVLLEELYCVSGESVSGFGTRDESGIFVTFRVVPTAESKKNLFVGRLQGCHPLVKF